MSLLEISHRSHAFVDIMDEARDLALELLNLKRSNYTGVDLLSGGTVGVSASFKELSDHGVIGSPSLATKEKGTELYETITDKISDFILDFSKWKKPLNGKNE